MGLQYLFLMTTFKRSQWRNTPEFFFAGIFNSRPPQPRYCLNWNVQTVIDFIKSEWDQNEDLLDKYLTNKLTVLFALTSASQVLGLHLDIRFMTKGTLLCSLSENSIKHGGKENPYLH